MVSLRTPSQTSHERPVIFEPLEENGQLCLVHGV
jgi:hypothetical protein